MQMQEPNSKNSVYAPYRLQINHGRKLAGGVAQGQWAKTDVFVKPGLHVEDFDHMVANEYIAGGLAQRLGLPVPPHALVTANIIDSQQKEQLLVRFATMDFTGADPDKPNESKGPFPLSDPSLCATQKTDISTGVLLFDIWIANPDRHANNMSYRSHVHPYDVAIFDHGHSLLGHERSHGIGRLESLKDRLGISGGTMTGQNRHVLLDVLPHDTFFARWVERIEQIPDFQIDDLCFTHYEINIEKNERVAISDFLKYRRDKMWHVIGNNGSEFKKVQWSLASSGYFAQVNPMIKQVVAPMVKQEANL